MDSEMAIDLAQVARNLPLKPGIYIFIEDAGPPAAVLMSILQTCAEHDVNAIDYLRDVLVRVSQPGSAAELDDLTPQGWKRSPAAKDRVAANRRAIADAVQSLTIPAPL